MIAGLISRRQTKKRLTEWRMKSNFELAGKLNERWANKLGEVWMSGNWQTEERMMADSPVKLNESNAESIK